MKYLLDTHTFLWFITDDKQLSRRAKKAIENPDADKFVSIASLWEMAIKISIGKMELDFPFAELVRHLDINAFELLPISFTHALELSTLTRHHGDPFDRMIICQALTEGLTVIGKDANFPSYQGLKLLW